MRYVLQKGKRKRAGNRQSSGIKEEIDESVGSMQLNYCMLGVRCPTDVLPLLKSLGFTLCVCVCVPVEPP